MNQDIIISIMDAVAKKLQEVFVLAYHLKLHDGKFLTKNSDKILLSNVYASNIPLLAKKIIASNKLIGKELFMPEQDSQFELSTGSNFAYHFKYEESDK